jgi:Arylsulfotransferase (ASST)
MNARPLINAPTAARRHWRRVTLSAAALVAAVASPSLAVGTASAATPTAPPPLTLLTNHVPRGGGDYFITPTGDRGTYANGPEIVSSSGKVIWFHAIPPRQRASDFRTQTYDGQLVLTWWQGSDFGGLSNGTDYIYNSHYQQIATVNAGNGDTTDGHEFLITPQNTALITSFDTATANLTSIGGPSDQTVIDGIVQEVDIATGRVLFQWDSADHVPYSDSEQPLPASASTPWDWFHLNAVHLDTDGNLLIDSRATWTAFKVNQATGAIIWQLGGKQSSFTLQAAPGQTLDSANEIFAWQHDPEAIGDDEYTFFDNDSEGTPLLPYSREVTVTIDPSDRVATLVSSIDQPEGLSASSQGNAQTLSDGDLVIGWGKLPYFSEFSPTDQLLFNAEFPAGVNTYRAFSLPWNG